MTEKKRCTWASGLDDPEYIRYHDEEWGRPSHDDRHLFEMLILKGAQAGLSWSTVLHKRANCRKQVPPKRRTFMKSAPKRLGEYPLLGAIGKGSMGVLYKSVEPRTGRPVALK